MTVKLRDFFAHYRGEPHQLAAVELLASQMPASLLKNDAEWVEVFRSAPASKPKATNTWEGVYASAKAAGAKYPELVSAQWALESGWGQHTSGKHNYFGLKGPGTSAITQEVIKGNTITITDEFLNFRGLDECVQYLVDRWYCNWNGYTGINAAPNRNAAARELVRQGYATDPSYAEKVVRLMDEKAPLSKPVAPASKFTPQSPFSTKVTPHITYGELCLNENARRFIRQDQCNIALELCEFAEKARAHFGGKPIIITSGHRPLAINASVGGATNSEHLYNFGCGAIDFYLDGVSVQVLQDWCDKNWPFSLGYGAIKGFVHLGIRAGRNRVRWDY